MFNIIFPAVVFVSLGVIVFIIGKHLPEFVDIKRSGEKSIQNKYFGRFLKKLFKGISSFLMWLMEKVIEKIKSFLSLIQSWVMKNRNKNQPESKFDEKMKTPEKNESAIKEDFFASKREDDNEEKNVSKSKETKIGKTSKFITHFTANMKDKILEKKREKINKVFEEEGEDSRFSDGIVNIQKEEKRKDDKENKLINEVVEVEKTSDEEIGVDRHILEKKLINKITANPKDKEIYRQLGELYLKMDNFEDARSCYNQILKINPRDVDATRKIERIRLLKKKPR